MSAAVSAYVRVVLTDPDCPLDATARHWLEVVGHYANRDGEAWPSVDVIAARMGVTAATARRARARVVAAGYLAVDISHGRVANRYRFPVADPLGVIPNPRASARGGTPPTRAETTTNPRASARQPARQRATKYQEEPIEAPAAHELDTTPPWVAARIAKVLALPVTVTSEHDVPDGATWEEYA